ncbi:DNA topoisomerase IB [Rhodopila sp.]|uniref:DNA topoisomerase IB n=1 Tax=Rhodopila sp. TaxID=2480087 RepID=UPI003D144E79
MSQAPVQTTDPHPFSLSPDILKATAKAAKLRYVSDRTRGIRRELTGEGFEFYDPKGAKITDDEELSRIRKLAIPPAYQDVWICPHANGHLQATGRDARGRKQYRYHPRWRQVRDEGKYGKMLLFGKVLPTIRAQAERDLARRGLPREKVLAAIVRLLESTLIRVGNEEYAKTNNSFGLTTLRNRHVKVEGENRIRFDFRGKSGTEHHIDLRNRKLAAIVRRCQDMPGQELFQYLDDEGQPHTVGSDEVNDYLQEITGEEITAKDFRTWAATNLAALALQRLEVFDSQAKAKKNVVQAVEAVSKMLGNTPAICRKCYIHPGIFDGYLDGSLLEALKQRTEEKLADPGHGLRAEEAAVMAFLDQQLGGSTTATRIQVGAGDRKKPDARATAE